MAAPLKRCLVRRRDGREQHGLAASCLRELRDKGEEEEGGTHGDRPGTAGLYASPGGEARSPRWAAVRRRFVGWLPGVPARCFWEKPDPCRGTRPRESRFPGDAS